MRGKNLQKLSTFTDLIYKDIKKSILDGKLKSGQRIKVREIARSFNASITPVREAIQRLAAEDYLTINARSEVRVTSASIEEIKEKLELIRVLDRYELAKVLPRFPQDVLAELKQLTGKLEQSYKQNNIKEFTKLSLKIHFKIWETYENKTIYQEIIQACERVSILEHMNLNKYYTPKVLYKSYRHHCDLIGALEEKNLKKAIKVLKSHFSEEYLKE
jgi:DNA-binding GntR family transcriptional regulator